jgi:hypothetical protein
MYYVTLTKSTSQFAVYSLYIYILSAGLINTGICNDLARRSPHTYGRTTVHRQEGDPGSQEGKHDNNSEANTTTIRRQTRQQFGGGG